MYQGDAAYAMATDGIDQPADETEESDDDSVRSWLAVLLGA